MSWELLYQIPIIQISCSRYPRCALWNCTQNLLQFLILDIPNFSFRFHRLQVDTVHGILNKYLINLQINQRLRSRIDIYISTIHEFQALVKCYYSQISIKSRVCRLLGFRHLIRSFKIIQQCFAVSGSRIDTLQE